MMMDSGVVFIELRTPCTSYTIHLRKIDGTTSPNNKYITSILPQNKMKKKREKKKKHTHAHLSTLETNSI